MAHALPLPARATDRDALTATIQKMADDYVAARGEPEHVPGVSVRLSLPGGGETVDVVSGRLSREPDAPPMTPDTLFQIGSITKSITPATLLQSQDEGKPDLDDPLGA